MPVVNKDLVLKSIASLVGKGSFAFDAASRPVIEKGGRSTFVKSIGYDFDSGALALVACDGHGRELATVMGVRFLAGLGMDALKSIHRTLGESAVRRQENTVRHDEGRRERRRGFLSK